MVRLHLHIIDLIVFLDLLNNLWLLAHFNIWQTLSRLHFLTLLTFELSLLLLLLYLEVNLLKLLLIKVSHVCLLAILLKNLEQLGFQFCDQILFDLFLQKFVLFCFFFQLVLLSLQSLPQKFLFF